MDVSVLFSEPKIPQFACNTVKNSIRRCFSALQRAENSSIPIHAIHTHLISTFQCSSASRKFLNDWLEAQERAIGAVSVLFSEPKIPQCRVSGRAPTRTAVSVLFSEPKIPQCALNRNSAQFLALFQCSSASRKFLNRAACTLECRNCIGRFSALQRAENSSICQRRRVRR